MFFLDGPDSIHLNSKSPLILREFDDVTVACTADCYKSCSFKWTFRSIVKSSTPELHFGYIRRTDAGIYTCTVINMATNKSANTSVSLDVFCK